MTCLIDAGKILSDCLDAAIGGVTGRVWLINKVWWDDAVAGAGVTIAADNSISAIDLTAALAPAQAFRFETVNGSVVTANPFTKNANGSSGLVHTVTMTIADLSMAVKDSLNSLFNYNLCVAIVETQAQKPAASAGGDTLSPPYVLFGITMGLELSAGDNNLGDAAVGNSLIVTLTTPVNSQLEKNWPTNVDMSTADIVTLETPIV